MRSKRTLQLWAAVLAVLLSGGMMVAPWCARLLEEGRHFLDVERCLDAGGAWDERAAGCRFNEETGD